jgi:hypothetical protein
MALDVTDKKKFPHYETITVSTNATEILLPSQCNMVQIGSPSQELWVGQNDCTDGQTIPSDKRFFVPANNAYEVAIGRGQSRAQSIFISAQSGNATVYVALVEK